VATSVTKYYQGGGNIFQDYDMIDTYGLWLSMQVSVHQGGVEK
jgi:hypothetical protein